MEFVGWKHDVNIQNTTFDQFNPLWNCLVSSKLQKPSKFAVNVFKNILTFMFSAFRSPFLFPIFHFLQLSVSISCWSSNPGVSIPGAGGSGPNIPALKFLVFLQTLIALVHVCVIAFGAKLCRTKAGMGNPDQTPLEEII